MACNYEPNATVDNGSCASLDECGICGGAGILPGACDCAGNVIDECGECGGDGIAEGACDCNGNTLDQCGVCGGDGTSCLGCTDPTNPGFDPAATIDDGSCLSGGCLIETGATMTQVRNISSLEIASSKPVQDAPTQRLATTTPRQLSRAIFVSMLWSFTHVMAIASVTAMKWYL